MSGAYARRFLWILTTSPISRSPRVTPQGAFTMATQRAGMSREVMLDLNGAIGAMGFSSYVSVRS